MISADVKSNIKQQEIKDLVAASYKLPINNLQNFKYNKKVVYFSFDFGYRSIGRNIDWPAFYFEETSYSY